MIKKLYSAVILLSLAAPAMVVAAEKAASDVEVHGIAELGARTVNEHNDSALFQEFRELEDAVFGQVQLDAFMGAYHLQLDADIQGVDDQSYQIKGGDYGNFKYTFNYDEMRHNYTFDAITPFTGVGSKHLVATPDDPTTWTKFDYEVEHQNYGGEIELSLHSPFYINIGADKQKQNDLRPYSISGFFDFKETPEPISNNTDNLHLKGGYLGESLSASLTGSLSSFNNDNRYLYSGLFTNDNIAVLPPDNDYNKLTADLAWRHLPINSVLALSGSVAHLKNDVKLSNIGLSAADFTNLNRTKFTGDIDYTNAAIALTSQPLAKLDSKIYYRYTDKDNSSSVIAFGSDPADPSTNADLLMSYQQDDAGIDLTYRLPYKTKAEAGYEYLKKDRSSRAGGDEVVPTETTKDDSVYVQLKNNTLDWMTAKVRYKHLERNSDELGAPTPFYYQDQSQDQWKLGFDFSPVESVDLGLDFTYKNIDYDHSIDTRQNDKRRDVYFDATWRATKIATLTGFAGFEKVDTDANRITDSADPINSSLTQAINDDFWAYGLAANVAATDKLTFNLSWQYQESDGEVSFGDVGNNVNFGIGLPLEDIKNSDDYTKKQLGAKAIYAFDPKLKITLGYLYEKFEYKDINYQNYTNVVDSSTYYSGLYANPNYEANIGYLVASYGF